MWLSTIKMAMAILRPQDYPPSFSRTPPFPPPETQAQRPGNASSCFPFQVWNPFSGRTVPSQSFPPPGKVCACISGNLGEIPCLRW